MDNPYVVVGSPSYAAPLLDFSVLSGRGPQQAQQNQRPNAQPNQPNNPAYNLGSSVSNFGQGLMRYLNPPQPVGMPTNIGPASVAGANTMLSGLY
jgi:hypothetical protein